MPIVISSIFSGMGANQLLQSYDASWVKETGGTYSLQGTGTGGRRLRLSNGVPGGASIYRNSTILTQDQELQWDATFFGGLSTRNVTVSARCNAARTHQYTVDMSGTSIQLYRENPGAVLLGSFSLVPTLGVRYDLKLRMVGSQIDLSLNGSLIISLTDPTPVLSYDSATIRIQTVVSGTGATDSNSVQMGYFILETLGGNPPVPQDITSIPAVSRSAVAQVTLTRETIFLDFQPAVSESSASIPSLIPGPATLQLLSAYSNSLATVPFLQSGQGMMPQPALSQSIVQTPVLIPGPATINSVPAESLSKVKAPYLAMALVLSSVPAFSLSKARRPTLKSRFDCCSLAPLQSRAQNQVMKEGPGCGPGVRGSDGLVRW